MGVIRAFAVLIGFAIAAQAFASTPSAFQSPWDLKPVELSNQPYDCGPPAPLAADILGSPRNAGAAQPDDVRTPTYTESIPALRELNRRVVASADEFRITGSREAAGCVIELLTAAANNGAMTGYIRGKNGLYYQNEALRSFSIAYLKVRQANAGSPEQNAIILKWFEELANDERDFYSHNRCGFNRCDYDAHRGLEAASATMSVGVAANDAAMVHWAEDRYRAGVRQIDSHGFLPLDMDGTMALRHNLKSAAALVQMAEFAEVNGVPLYTYDKARIHVLVHMVAVGIGNTNVYAQQVGREQHVPSEIVPWEISWASAYNRRFKDPVIDGLISQVGTAGNDMWGGDPWDGDN